MSQSAHNKRLESHHAGNPVHVHAVVGRVGQRLIKTVVLSLVTESASCEDRLRQAGADIITVAGAAACEKLERVCVQSGAEVLVVCVAEGVPHATLAWAARRAALPSVVVMHANPSVAIASACMRAGVTDLVDPACPRLELKERLHAAAMRTLRARRAGRAAIRKERKTAEVADALERSKRELAAQVGGMCEQLAGSCRDFSDQLRTVALASELETLMRQELEVESLLRTTLEFLLRKAGPMNAAIFLPASSGDYSLGAYVNYDCPRESAEGMLDSLCGVVAPAFEEKPGLHVVQDVGEFARGGTPLHWMNDHALVVYSCVHQGECLGVLTVFRDRRTPWTNQTLRVLAIIGELFGKQVHRTIRTHHRHQAGFDGRDAA